MTTAAEMILRAAPGRKAIERYMRRMERQASDLLIYGCHMVIGRNVCLRRARKLIRRGEDVRYAGRTTNGKARYTWMKRVPPVEWIGS